jgi:ABC-type bacteriocin/lantibiotic exporter with double-glycine peptidase domain
LARGLFTNPKLLVLDEATSTLDAETEAAVTSALRKLKGSVTLVIIAHRLSTVRDADSVIYFERNQVPTIGTFDFIRQNVSNFDKQAQLMGL